VSGVPVYSSAGGLFDLVLRTFFAELSGKSWLHHFNTHGDLGVMRLSASELTVPVVPHKVVAEVSKIGNL